MNEQLQPLMLIDYTNRKVEATNYVREQERIALEQAALIGKVTNAEQNGQAVSAQLALAEYKKAVTNAEEAAKGPLNQLRKGILDLSKELIKSAEAEGMRLAGLVGDFQEGERVRLLAEQKAASEELSELAKKEAVEISACATVEEQDAVREKFAMDALAVQSSTVAPVRATGQVVKTDWEITVINEQTIARVHPNCVKITPLLMEIKTLLNMGVEVKGVSAVKKTTASVRSKPQPKPIEV